MTERTQGPLYCCALQNQQHIATVAIVFTFPDKAFYHHVETWDLLVDSVTIAQQIKVHRVLGNHETIYKIEQVHINRPPIGRDVTTPREVFDEVKN